MINYCSKSKSVLLQNSQVLEYRILTNYGLLELEEHKTLTEPDLIY